MTFLAFFRHNLGLRKTFCVLQSQVLLGMEVQIYSDILEKESQEQRAKLIYNI